jgi:cation transport protein ChaC
MTPDPDAFVHLPALRDHLVAAQDSELRVTPDVLAFWDRRAQALGRGPDWRLTDEAIEASRRELLGERAAAQDLWVYCYGSLMWDPGIHFCELRLAELDGWQRRFTYRTSMGRGTPERPALMLTLEDRPGCCRGLAFRIAAARVDEESAILWRREMIRGGYRPQLLPLRTPQGPVTALVFTANTAHADHVGELPLERTAAIIAGASGVIGSNRDYLLQLAAQLRRLGIRDDYIDRLESALRAAT